MGWRTIVLQKSLFLLTIDRYQVQRISAAATAVRCACFRPRCHHMGQTPSARACPSFTTRNKLPVQRDGQVSPHGTNSQCRKMAKFTSWNKLLVQEDVHVSPHEDHQILLKPIYFNNRLCHLVWLKTLDTSVGYRRTIQSVYFQRQ